MSPDHQVVKIVFSPTGGTQKVADIIANELGTNVTEINLARNEGDYRMEIAPNSIAVIAMPSFGGRAPAVAIDRLRQINGNGARCILVCVYGNRAWEDTLVEMEDAAREAGFTVTAAIAAVAQHSIMPQYGLGRPDAEDAEQLKVFAKSAEASNALAASIPGVRPYKKAGGLPLAPKTTRDCIKCGICVDECPVGAIDPDTIGTNSKQCIACMSCVRRCPSKARKLNGVVLAAAGAALRKACAGRKPNQLFL